MVLYPSAEQFYLLAEAGERYSKTFQDAWQAVRSSRGITTSEQAIVELAKLAMEVSAQAFESCLEGECLGAFEWLTGRPEFVIAQQAVGFVPLGEEGYSGKFQRIIKTGVELGPERAVWFESRRLAAASGKYLEYVAGVSQCAAGLISGNAARRALRGDPVFDRIQELTEELQKIIQVDWMPSEAKASLSMHLERLSKSAERHRPATITKRNDPDLPARLMATDLIQLHHSMFSATHKRAVYQLMGLPFISRPLEIRTIERLAKAAKKAG